MATKKGTRQHGYETNIRAHYLPHFGDWLLAETDVEAVQKFLNLKLAAGKSFNTLKDPKWGIEFDLYRGSESRRLWQIFNQQIQLRVVMPPLAFARSSRRSRSGGTWIGNTYNR
jgi:hypothetical protein